MSDPVRYDEVWGEWSGEPAGLAPTKGGEWVKWEDYASLKAEVERLRKAGDEMAEAGGLAGCSECFGMYDRLENALKAWNDAQEGKPSV